MQVFDNASYFSRFFMLLINQSKRTSFWHTLVLKWKLLKNRTLSFTNKWLYHFIVTLTYSSLLSHIFLARYFRKMQNAKWKHKLNKSNGISIEQRCFKILFTSVYKRCRNMLTDIINDVEGFECLDQVNVASRGGRQCLSD